MGSHKPKFLVNVKIYRTNILCVKIELKAKLKVILLRKSNTKKPMKAQNIH